MNIFSYFILKLLYNGQNLSCQSEDSKLQWPGSKSGILTIM